MATHDRLGRSRTTVLDRPQLVVVCGLPGVGKTTVAEAIADRTDGTLLRTDVVRKELRPDPEYTDEETQLVYGTVFEEARARIERGRDVVLDGTFRTSGFRERATALADELGASIEVVKVECAEEAVRGRLEHRENDASDADFEVHETLRERFDPLATEHVAVENSGSLAETYQQVEEHF